MLANTLSLTIGAGPAIVLTRNREDGGVALYEFKDATRILALRIRQEKRSNKSAGTVSSVFNVSLVYNEASTPTVLGKTYTASFTGSFEDFGDPTFASNMNKALHVLGATFMVNLAGGEI